MFKRRYRLREALAKTAVVYHDHFFTLRILQNTLPHNRYRFVASRRIDKRAVVRNRVRRVLRACVEQEHPALKQGYDMIFSIKKSACEVKTGILQKAINNMFRRAMLL